MDLKKMFLVNLKYVLELIKSSRFIYILQFIIFNFKKEYDEKLVKEILNYEEICLKI